MFLGCGNNISNLTINKHHLIKKHQNYFLEELNSIKLHNIQLNMQLILKVGKPTYQTYFEKNFQNLELEWIYIYIYIYIYICMYIYIYLI